LKKINKYIKIFKYCYRYLPRLLYRLLNHYLISICYYLSDDLYIGEQRFKIIIKFIFFFCFFFTRNPYFGLDLLDLFSNNYLDLIQGNNFVYINGGNNPKGFGSFNANSGGPSNPNPRPNYNFLRSYDNIDERENYKKRMEQYKDIPIESVFSLELNDRFDGKQYHKRVGEPLTNEPSNKKNKGKQAVSNSTVNESVNNATQRGYRYIQPALNNTSDNNRTELVKNSVPKKEREVPTFFDVSRYSKFSYINPETNRRIYPEGLHQCDVKIFNNVYVYDEPSMRYLYNATSPDPSKRYLKITYPDTTTCTIYDIPTMHKNIQFHKDATKLGYEQKPTFWYENYFKEHFGKYRKDVVTDKIDMFSKYNNIRKIGPNEIPKDNQSRPDKKTSGQLVPSYKKINKKFLFEK
jgi:hypothetical protein